MRKSSASRGTFILAALATIVIGLIVHRTGASLPPAIRDKAGDVLWAMMIYWLISAFAPGTSRISRTVVAVTICWTVEVSQLYHTTSLDHLRATTLGQLMLGSGFDPRDLAAYATGVFLAVLIEVMVRRPDAFPSGRAPSF